MNYKKLIILITISNLAAWLLLEMWIVRYSDGVANFGAGVLVFIQLIGYYIITISSQITKEKE